MLQRRHLLKLTLGSVASAQLLGCGGGDDAPPEGDPVDTTGWATDEVLEPGLAPELQQHLPDPQPIHVEFLREALPLALSAHVFCGDEPQIGVPVRFYDIDGQTLASGTTDEQGHFSTGEQLLSRRFVLAVASTPHGELHGLQLVLGFQRAEAIEVNLYQTLASHLFLRMGSEYNVINYVLQDHYGLDFSQDIWDVRRDHPQLSQQRMREAMQQQPSLNAFLNQQVDDILAQLPADAHHNPQFSPAPAKAAHATPPSGAKAALDDREIIGYCLTIGEGVLNQLVKFPGSGPVFSFIFGRVRGQLLPPQDPFADMREALRHIESRLLDLKNLVVELKFRPHVQELESYWNTGLLSSLEDIIALNRDRTTPMQPWELARMEERANFLLRNGERLLDSASNKFFGCGSISTPNAYLHNLYELLQNSKFYGEQAQTYNRSQLANFMMNQTMGYIAVWASMIYRLENEGHDSTYIAGALAPSTGKWQQMCKRLLALECKNLPERAFIQHQTGKAWVGMCGDVGYWPDFVKPSVKAIKLEYDWINGTGTSTGVNNSRYMLKSSQNPQGVPQETVNWAPWRLPTVNELKDAFLSEAKSTGKKLNVYAYEQGVGSKTPFCRHGTTKLATIVTDSINTTYVNGKSENNGGTCDRVYFEKLSVEKGSVGSDYRGDVLHLYRNKKVYGYFPVADLSEQQLNLTLPWRVYRLALGNQLCSG